MPAWAKTRSSLSKPPPTPLACLSNLVPRLASPALLTKILRISPDNPPQFRRLRQPAAGRYNLLMASYPEANAADSADDDEEARQLQLQLQLRQHHGDADEQQEHDTRQHQHQQLEELQLGEQLEEQLEEHLEELAQQQEQEQLEQQQLEQQQLGQQQLGQQQLGQQQQLEQPNSHQQPPTSSPHNHTQAATTTTTTTNTTTAPHPGLYDASTLATSSVPATAAAVAHHGLQILQAASAASIPMSHTGDALAQQYAQSAALEIVEPQFSSSLADPTITAPAMNMGMGTHASQKVTRLRRACDMCSQRKVKVRWHRHPTPPLQLR